MGGAVQVGQIGVVGGGDPGGAILGCWGWGGGGAGSPYLPLPSV